MLLCGLSAAAWAQNFCIVRMPSLQGSYAGDCVAGYASGLGRAVGVDRYEGSFRDGLPTGRGIYTYADGRRFEGHFVDGQAVGPMRFVYPNGDVLQGDFRQQQLVGVGRMTRASGAVLLVQMQGGAMVVLSAQSSPGVPAPQPSPQPVPQVASAGLVPATAAPVLVPVLSPGPAPAFAPATSANAAGAQAVVWAPRLDFEDIFASYILAASTRKPIAASAAAAAPRGDPLALAGGADTLLGPRARASLGASATALSRYASGQGDAIYLGDPWGLVGIKLSSAQPQTEVTLRVTIDDFAEPTEQTFTLPKPGTYALYPKLRYRFDRLRNVLQPVPVNVTWAVAIDGVNAGTRTQTVRLRSVQDAPYQLKTERGVENLSWVFAGFVTEDAPWIDELLKEAFAKYGSGPVGYQQGADAVDRQVEIVFDYLRQRGVKYSSITATSGASDRVSSQTVRFPSDSVRNAQANCVDGSVLMASILRKMGVEPLIITGPGHAMLGYIRDFDLDKPDAYRVLETTMIGDKVPFAAALQRGMATYKEWEAKAQNHPHFKVVMVAAMRKQGVLPIAR